VDAESLFTAHSTRLFKYFCRAVGRAEIARDLTQEVFVRVSRTQAPSRADADSTAWLFRIARNLAIDHSRKRLRQPEPSALLDDPVRVATQDVDFAVREALATLAPLDRDVFLMREVAGLGYEEIAAACELSEDAVRSRLHRTRLHLRDHLAAPIATSRTIASGRTPKAYETSEP
jgi:RNA polymerase sigma-70 factor, ECF subfamily